MSYDVENVNGCTKKFIFKFETLDLTAEIKTSLVQKQKKSNLKGFRKGKAPLAMVEKMYGNEVETDALNSFIQNQLFQAVDKEKLRVVGYPKFENMKYDTGKSVSFEALVEIFPEVKITNMSDLSFTKDKIEINDEDLNEIEKNYLGPKAEMKELSDESAKLEKGQFAVINFQGEKPDGEKPESMKGEEFLLEIGSNQFIPGFEEKMIGMKKGEKKNVDLTFPEDYHADDLKGIKVIFAVELLEIKEKKYPEFTDELAKEFGFDSVDDFKEKNLKNIATQKERASKEKLHQEILEKLIEVNPFDIPAALIAQQETHLKEEVKKNLLQQGFNEDMMADYFDKWKGDLITKAQFQVKSGLILDTLGKEYEIETSDADFDKKLEEIAGGSGMDKNQVKEYYGADPKIKSNLMYAIREEKTFEIICQKIKLS